MEALLTDLPGIFERKFQQRLMASRHPPMLTPAPSSPSLSRPRIRTPSNRQRSAACNGCANASGAACTAMAPVRTST